MILAYQLLPKFGFGLGRWRRRFISCARNARSRRILIRTAALILILTACYARGQAGLEAVAQHRTPVASALDAAFIYDTVFGSALAACEATRTVAVTSSALWSSLSTMNCSAPLWFPAGTGAKIQPARRQTVRPCGSITAAPTQQIFDVSAGGTVTPCAKSAAAIYPQWWGAKFNGSSGTDDTAGNQAAINAHCASGIPLHYTGGTSYNNTASGGKILSVTCGSGMNIPVDLVADKPGNCPDDDGYNRSGPAPDQYQRRYVGFVQPVRGGLHMFRIVERKRSCV